MVLVRFGVGSGIALGFVWAGAVITNYNLLLLAVLVFYLLIRLVLLSIFYKRRRELALKVWDTYGTIAGFSGGFAITYIGIISQPGLVILALLLATPLIIGYDFLELRRAKRVSDAIPREGYSLEYHRWFRKWMRNFLLAHIPSVAFLLAFVLVFPHMNSFWLLTLVLIIYLFPGSFMLLKFFRGRKQFRI